MCLCVCVCERERERERCQRRAVYLKNVSIIIWHQILESIVHGPKIHSEFTIQSVNRETWLGAEGDVLHCFVFFTQNFPGPLKLSSLGHCSCAVPTFHWHSHGMVCLECLHPPKYFWIKLIPFPSVVQHLLH